VGFNLGHALSTLGHNIASVPSSLLKDAEQIVQHPQFLAANLLAPGIGPLVLGQLERTGQLRPLLQKAGLGAITSGGALSINGHKPAPRPVDMPILTRDGVAECGKVEGGQPFTLNGFKNLAAGSQTQGTDLVDFHASTSNPTVISTDDLIPGNIEVFEADLFIGARATTTLGFEGPGFLSSFWLIEYVNGIEKARWSMRSLGAAFNFTGGISSGQASHTYDVTGTAAVPWHRKYDPNVKAKTALQIPVTTTTVNSLDNTLVEEGVRP
jgi:hypothetical protein